MHYPHCPNKACRYHSGPTPPVWYKHHGVYTTKTFGSVPRFRCLCCYKTFSAQTFSIDYYAKIVLNYQTILEEIGTGAGCNDLARICGCGIKTILNKLERLSRSSVALQARAVPHLSYQEAFCYDGFESFSCSQYFPNNIGVLVGAKSQFLYSIDYTTLRRKGRMTRVQKLKRSHIEKQHRAPKGSLTRSVMRSLSDLYQRLSHKGVNEAELISDEHRVYKNVIHRLPQKPLVFTHKRISSRLSRTNQNPLFPVNYIDRQIRKDNSDHHRETVQFAKCPAGMMSRMAIYQMLHNFHKPYRIRAARRGDDQTHAEVAGLSSGKLADLLGGLGKIRPFLSKLELTWNEQRLWFGDFSLPGTKTRRYRPQYLQH